MSEETACVFIKKKRSANIRRGQNSDEDDHQREEQAKPKTSAKDSSSDSSDADEDAAQNSDNDLAENLSEMKAKMNKKASFLTHSTKQIKEKTQVTDSKGEKTLYTAFQANKNAKRTGPDDMGATATYELDTAVDRDTQVGLLFNFLRKS